MPTLFWIFPAKADWPIPTVALMQNWSSVRENFSRSVRRYVGLLPLLVTAPKSCYFFFPQKVLNCTCKSNSVTLTLCQKPTSHLHQCQSHLRPGSSFSLLRRTSPILSELISKRVVKKSDREHSSRDDLMKRENASLPLIPIPQRC